MNAQLQKNYFNIWTYFEILPTSINLLHTCPFSKNNRNDTNCNFTKSTQTQHPNVFNKELKYKQIHDAF